MEIAFKFLAPALVVAGGGSIVPIALWQTGYIGNAGVERSISSRLAKTEEGKNCIVINKDSEREILKGLEISDKDYSIISCENTGDLAPKWKGYFPGDVLELDLDVGEKFEMQTFVKGNDRIDEDDEITFLSGQLTEREVVGKWGDEYKYVGEKQITVVKFEGDFRGAENAYLLFEKRDNE